MAYDNYEGKVVVITGIASGIAYAACKLLLSLNAIVIGADIVDKEKVDSAFYKNDRFTYQRTDITSEDQVERLFNLVDQKYKRLDVLLNIAGGWKDQAPIEKTTLEQWNSVISLNLTAVFLTCRLAVPLMRKNKYGRIVNFSSIAGRQPLGRSIIAYPAAKAALIGMTRYLVAEVGIDGITVNAVSPGTILTERTRKTRTPEDIERIKEKIPLRRLAEVEDAVNAMMFFISEGSGYITGHTIDVNGGVYMN
jgi:3-oxoacyl-[acyl-carrier protein] reductase